MERFAVPRDDLLTVFLVPKLCDLLAVCVVLCDGYLVTHSANFVMTHRVHRVFSDHMRVVHMQEYMGQLFITVSLNDVFTLLYIISVYDILTLIMLIMLGDLDAFNIFLIMTISSRGGGTHAH